MTRALGGELFQELEGDSIRLRQVARTRHEEEHGDREQGVCA